MLKEKEEEFEKVVQKVMAMKSEVDSLTAERDKLETKSMNLDAKVSV